MKLTDEQLDALMARSERQQEIEEGISDQYNDEEDWCKNALDDATSMVRKLKRDIQPLIAEVRRGRKIIEAAKLVYAAPLDRNDLWAQLGTALAEERNGR